MKRLLVVMLLSTASFAVQAAEPINVKVATAKDLAELCGANPKESAADAKINFCHGFAQGAVDVAVQQAGEKKLFCFPSPPPKRTQTLTEFVNWVRALPAHQSLGATQGLFQFLGERFPCK
jgi:hypothetical protein